jgi:hypothetical protein
LRERKSPRIPWELVYPSSTSQSKKQNGNIDISNAKGSISHLILEKLIGWRS